MHNIHEADKLTEIELIEHNTMMAFRALFEKAIAVVHRRNEKWWINIHTGERIERNFGEIIALVHSELSEALEGHRKNLMDDKLPARKMVEVELADAIIRIMDLASGYGLDVANAWYEKMQYNYTREDHTIAHRLGEHGKKY
jgi:hypothetical protein